MGLLSTIFLHKTVLNWRDNSQIILQNLSNIQIDITKSQAKIIAKMIESPIWDWHIILGYILGILLIWRIILFISPSGKYNYQNFKTKSLHKKIITIGYIGIYLLLIFMSISGYLIHFYKDLGILKSTAHDIKEIHEFLYLGILIFVPLHIIGVVISDNYEQKGIVSDMINGG